MFARRATSIAACCCVVLALRGFIRPIVPRPEHLQLVEHYMDFTVLPNATHELFDWNQGDEGPRYDAAFWTAMANHGPPSVPSRCDFSRSDKTARAFLVVRSVFAERMIDSQWSFYFLTEMHESIKLEDVMGIDVGGLYITDVRCTLRPSYDQGWINTQEFNHVGQQVVLKCRCHGPIAPIKLTAAIVLRHGLDICSVPSLSPVHVINNNIAPDRLGVCLGVLRGSPNTLHHFLNHYKKSGVDVILMYTTYEFWISNREWIQRWSRISHQSIRINIWPAFFPMHSYSQQLAYLDCSMRRDDFRYMIQVDSDDFLVDRHLQPFDIKHYLREKNAMENGRCAVWLSTWLEVTPPSNNITHSSNTNKDFLNQLTELPVTCRRRESKIVYDTARIRNLGVHWATVTKPYDVCKTRLKTIHATFRETQPDRCW